MGATSNFLASIYIGDVNIGDVNIGDLDTTIGYLGGDDQYTALFEKMALDLGFKAFFLGKAFIWVYVYRASSWQQMNVCAGSNSLLRSHRDGKNK